MAMRKADELYLTSAHIHPVYFVHTPEVGHSPVPPPKRFSLENDYE